MVDPASVSLADYLKGVLKERDLSIRGFATYAGLSHSTVRRILAGQNVDNPTLDAVAAYLRVSPELIYKMAGVLPGQQSARTAVLNEIEQMLSELPVEAQKKVRDMIRLEWEYSRINNDEEEQSRKAG